MQEMDDLESLLERVEYLHSILIGEATGHKGDDGHFQLIRKETLEHPVLQNMMPRWLRTNRNLGQFWQFIKNKFSTYAERRSFISEAFNPILEYLESGESLPAQQSIEDALKSFDSESVYFSWNKALERKISDPEGAITISRSIIESVCKHILDEQGVDYNSTNIELSELYKLTAKQLNLAPDQHNEQVFKQILGGCSGIINGLGSLRNKLGDAHGKGRMPVKPQARHAELAVNLAGSMSLFLISTYSASKTQ